MTPLWISIHVYFHFQVTNQKPSLNIFLHFYTSDKPQDADHGGEHDTDFANIKSHGMDMLKVKTLIDVGIKGRPCVDGDLTFQDGEGGECSDECNTSWCENGILSGTMLACENTSNWDAGTGDRPFVDGDQTSQNEERGECSDQCNTCWCNNGQLSGTMIDCGNNNKLK